MNLYFFICSSFFFFLFTSCSSGQKNKPLESSEVHTPINIQKPQPIEVPNVFPEKGLTDAHTIIKDGKLYAFCGHDKSWDTETTWLMDRWEIWSTTNLTDWKKESEILPTDTYIGDRANCWAGDVISKDGKYYWYFSNKNISTGVMVADHPAGPFKDALGSPLLPKGIAPTRAYDPEIYEENGIYTIIFGAGHYYAATLADDMISLADTPQPISVIDKEGKEMWTADKACIFKRQNKYYLIWEEKYAMADQLRGPYTYAGKSLEGGHCNVFVWNNQYYAMLENKDIGLFYRGVSLKPLHFNTDGTIMIPENDHNYPAHGRAWDFNHSRMGWKAISGTEVKWNQKNKTITGNIKSNPIIESSLWLLTKLEKHHHLTLRIKNNSDAKQAKISIASVNPVKGFFKKPEINWNNEKGILIDLKPNSNQFQEIKIDLSKELDLKQLLKRIRIEPGLNAKKGSWEIEHLSIH